MTRIDGYTKAVVFPVGQGPADPSCLLRGHSGRRAGGGTGSCRPKVAVVSRRRGEGSCSAGWSSAERRLAAGPLG
jgi:hypothetical protein